jgi:Flp pilus assembly protein TadB
MVSADEIIKKYSNKLQSDIGSFESSSESKDYSNFKEEMTPQITSYEKWAKSLGSSFKIKASEKDKEKFQKYLDEAHLNVTPEQALTLSALSLLSVFFVTILTATAIYLITQAETISGSLFAFVFLGFLASIFIFYYTYTLPQRLANSWKLKASSQMVPAILYLVIYMKHTSNLERAIEFAAQHLEGPLAFDFKKIFYDVQTSKYSTIKQSLDIYLEQWKEYSPEFIESVHLIESSLYEPSESRRILILEKSLQIMLDGIYEKMLAYSREIRSPLTNIYMLGIILPTLGLALIPLASTLLGGAFQWYHLFILFNVIIPFAVFFLTSEVLLKRPGGYGDSSVLELNPDYWRFTSKKPYINAAIIVIPLLIIGFLPFIFQIDLFTQSLGLQSDYSLEDIGLGTDSTMLFDFKTINTTNAASGEIIPLANPKKRGPFGPLSIVLSLFIPLALALFFSISYKQKTKVLMESREKTSKLEEEFTNSLFQLGNRLGDGLPPELAFSKVAQSTQGQMTNEFFVTINQNIQSVGMSVEQAIFDKRRGAIIYYPSSLIATSMRILIESSKKGLQVAARSLMSISDYIKNIHKINHRLRDLLAEVVSDMKSNMTFLAPLLSGIVVGLSSMIVIVLNKLEKVGTEALNSGSGIPQAANIIQKLFSSSEMIPPYFLQLSVGIYIVQITFILSTALVIVNSGKDSLREKYEISSNLKKSMILYFIASLFATLALVALASYAIRF